MKRLLGLGFVVLAFSALGCAPRQTAFYAIGGQLQPDTLAVSGTGEASAVPDVARMTLGVESSAPSAKAALTMANEAMRAVIAALKANGVEAKDIRTSDFSITSERPPEPRVPVARSTAASAPEGPTSAAAEGVSVASPLPAAPSVIYRVSNNVTVTVRNIDKLGDVLGAAVHAGANNAWGIKLAIDDPEPLHDQARVKAVADAKRRAEALAKLSGVKLGPVTTVAEEEHERIAPISMHSTVMEARSVAVPVEGGELGVTHTVYLVYRLLK